MKKQKALQALAPDDHMGRRILSIYDDQVPDCVVEGIGEQHKCAKARTFKPVIYCSVDAYKTYKDNEKH